MLYLKIMLFLTDLLYGTYLYKKIKNFGDSFLQFRYIISFIVVIFLLTLVLLSFWIEL